jgi:hypothetical protein
MTRKTALLILLSTAIMAGAGSGIARAQHLDVLSQQQNGRLVTGTGDFDHDAWTLGLRVFHRDFGSTYAINNPGFNSIGAGSPDMPAGASALPANQPLSWDFLPMTIGDLSANLFYWNGQDSDGVAGFTPADVKFGALPTPAYTLTLFDLNNVGHAVDGTNTFVPGGTIDNTASDGFMHRHLFFFLQDNDGDSSTTPADGLYLLALHLKMPGLATSLPVFMIFGTPGSSVSAEDDAALPWVEQQLNLPGDFNQDGVVDAADYVLWRNTKGQTGVGLPADGNGNQIVDQADYDLWRANFGHTSQLLVNDNSPTGAAASRSSDVVPEPSTAWLFCIAWLVYGFKRKCRDCC